MAENKKPTILITGGCGFVGHHVVEGVLKRTNWDIIILDGLDYAGNLNKLAGIPERLTDIEVWDKQRPRIRMIWHDLRAPISETTSNMIGRVDYVWHLAAQSHVERSLQDAVPFAMSNVVGTTHLLEWLKKHNPRAKTIIFSTDEVFGPAPEGIYFKENHRFRPSNPYAASKGGSELMGYAFAHSFKMPILVIRSMNIYGERQDPEKFIPGAVRRILTGEKVVIHGIPPQISSRCWIHARNVCDALIFLTAKGKPEQFYHVVGEERDVLYLADRISEIIKGRKLAKGEVEFLDWHGQRPGHDLRYALSGAKIAQMGWKPPMSFNESFDKMISWMIREENLRWLNL